MVAVPGRQHILLPSGGIITPVRRCSLHADGGMNKFNLDVSQIIHIPRNDAAKVIARFGDMSALVTQVLEPTIGNYFRNAAQGSDIIDFLKNRSVRQEEARD